MGVPPGVNSRFYPTRAKKQWALAVRKRRWWGGRTREWLMERVPYTGRRLPLCVTAHQEDLEQLLATLPQGVEIDPWYAAARDVHRSSWMAECDEAFELPQGAFALLVYLQQELEP
jgi:hypothetical protein